MKRRSLLSSTLSVALLAAAPLGSAALAEDLTPVSVRLGFISNVQYGDYYVADAKGYFADAGVKVTLIPGGPGTPQGVAELAAGQADIAISAFLPFVDALALGNDFVTIGVHFQSSPLGLISMAAAPITEAKDILGATILSQGNVTTSNIKALLEMNGLDRDDFKTLPAGFSPEPLIAGDAKGYTGFGTNQNITMQVLGYEPEKDYFFRSFDEMGLASVSDLLVVKRDYLEAHRDMLVKFMAALIKAQKDIEANPDEQAELATDVYGVDYGLDLTQQKLQSRAQIAFSHPGGDPDFKVYGIDLEKIMGPVIDATKLTSDNPIPDDLVSAFDTSIVDDAWASLR